jgi:E3 ubiquitin-protein ligase UBR7
VLNSDQAFSVAMSTLPDILATHETLIQQASQALPHDFSRCTYTLGPISQAVYLCLTCALPRGICSACSIACHTNHEQIELFPKRNFRCDCPTRVLQHPCTLHKVLEAENEGNVYGQNFHGGVFCRCGRFYDALNERETMIQCLACQVRRKISVHLLLSNLLISKDWFHESCLNLRERPSSRESSPVADPEPPTTTIPQPPTGPAAENDDDDNQSISSVSSSGLPPPLISASGYDTFICASCVSSIPTLTRYAGTPGILMVVQDEPLGAWKVLDSTDDSVDISEENAATGVKRPRPLSSSGAPGAKRTRTGTSPQPPASSSIRPQCLAPPPNPLAQKILSSSSSSSPSTLGAGDIFLTEGWRERWCHCPSVRPSDYP